MKIALVTPYDYPYPGGVTEHIRHLEREFRARGHDTRIIAPSTERPTALDARVMRVSDEVLPVPFNGSTARITLSPEVSRRVSKILRDERFDIVHLHEPGGPLLCLSVLYYSSAVNVGTFHAYSESGVLYRYAQPYMAWVHARLDGRIFVSPALRDSISAYFPGEYRIIPNGIDYNAFSVPGIKPIADFADGRPNILFVGRLDGRKGFQHLARAYADIKQAVPEARLIVVGAFGEGEKGRWAEYARAHGLRDIHLIGRVSAGDLARYYRTATVFCAPSTGGESFGIVLLEAMAAGVPIVASDIAGYRSVVQDGTQGCLVAPGDGRALARTITQLLQDAGRRKQMAARGRATAARYDWRVVAPRVLAYYEELLQARARQREPRVYARPTYEQKQELQLTGVSLALGGLMNVLLPRAAQAARAGLSKP